MNPTLTINYRCPKCDRVILKPEYDNEIRMSSNGLCFCEYTANNRIFHKMNIEYNISFNILIIDDKKEIYCDINECATNFHIPSSIYELVNSTTLETYLILGDI